MQWHIVKTAYALMQWVCMRNRDLVENYWTDEAYEVLQAVRARGLKASTGLLIAGRSQLWEPSQAGGWG